MKQNISQEDQGKKLRFFNEAVEYMKKYEYIDRMGSDNQQDNISSEESANVSNHNRLRTEMLEELNRLKEIILNNPDKKLKQMTKEEKSLFNNFIKHYSVCPICGNYNHYYNLKSIYFDEKLYDFKNFLIRNMKENLEDYNLNIFNLNIGVLCCNCYKNYYEE